MFMQTFSYDIMIIIISFIRRMYVGVWLRWQD